MPIITETQLRDLIRQPQLGMTITLPKDTRFSPSAMDFINHWKLEVVYGDKAHNAVDSTGESDESGEKPAWDSPGEFPVVFSGEQPRCITCGMPVKPKPEHMTQVDAEHFSPKNTPRIRFRGKMDTLNAFFLLVLVRAKTENLPQLADRLGTLAAYCREITSAEYNQRRVEHLVLDGLGDEELHKATHHPEKVIGVPHLVPGADDSEMLHWLNLMRCQVREAELIGLDAFAPYGDQPKNSDLVRAVNRLSNAVYYLALMYYAGKMK
jgi:ethanolamine utilization cobalamin adenosyltransferase